MKEQITKISAECSADIEVAKTFDISNMFATDDHLQSQYLLRYRRIPNSLRLYDINCKKANEWLLQNYGDKITDCYYARRSKKRVGLYISDVYYCLLNDLILYFDNEYSDVKLFYRKTDVEFIDSFVAEINKFKKRHSRKKPEIELLITTSRGLDTKSMVITSPKFDVEDNYNDDFLPVHEVILSRLRKKNDKGIVLLHGKPGTGKTSYIRYLITKVKKSVIFLPPNMAVSITDPGLMNVLIDNPNSVFVIEDAENIVIDRNHDRYGSSSVSALLNLADGLLSDCLNIQIICSFNTDLSRVDSALTRKGRLIAKYEFAELDAMKAQALSNKLGFTSAIREPMTLAAVYNQNEANFAISTQRKTIGFNIAV